VIRLIFCLLAFNLASASPVPVKWYEGSVVLANGEVWLGEISVEAFYDVVLFRHHSRTEVLPAHKVQSVYYHDSAKDVNCRFVSVQSMEHQSTYRLYEVIVSGPVCVLRRQAVRHADRLHDAFDYDYFVRQSNELVPLRKFATRIYPQLLKVSYGTLQRYAREKGLDPNQPACAVQLVRYFNYWVRSQESSLAIK
jgi:hypothetical protein